MTAMDQYDEYFFKDAGGSAHDFKLGMSSHIGIIG